MNALGNPRGWLVGECNPYGGRPEYALYPEPPRSAGGRLCRTVLGMQPRTYLRTFERRNLCQRKWSNLLALEAAAKIGAGVALSLRREYLILLGQKVHAAFVRAGHLPKEVPWEPFSARGAYAFLPHPSDRCRLWNDPQAIPKARAAVLSLAPHLEGLVGELGCAT